MVLLLCSISKDLILRSNILLQIYLVKRGWAICEQVAHFVNKFHASNVDAKQIDKISSVNDT